MKNILFLSGAGLSAPSGIRTFRDTNGLWEEYDVMEVCSAEGFRKDREKVMQFYNARRKDLVDKEPNEAHKMIARLKEKYPAQVMVLTQNVDNLLEKANCKEVIHLHGTLTDLRCEECEEVFEIGYKSSNKAKCPACKSLHVRHNVVMFGEAAPEYRSLYEALNQVKLLVCIGTSGQVLNVAHFAKYAKFSILNNLDKDPLLDSAFDICFHESSEVAALKIERLCEKFMKEGALS